MRSCLVITLVAIYGFTIVTSTPVLPHSNIDLSGLQTDACLYMCNICFDADVHGMLICANDACLHPLKYWNKGKPLVSRRCEDYITTVEQIKSYYTSGVSKM